MASVTGKIAAKWGVMNFHMNDAESATLVIDGVWMVHGVEWSGRIELYRNKPVQSWESVPAEQWREKVDGRSLRRVDKKDYNYKSVEKIANEMVNSFRIYFEHPNNWGVSVFAKRAELANARGVYSRAVDRAHVEKLKKAMLAGDFTPSLPYSYADYPHFLERRRRLYQNLIDQDTNHGIR